MVDVFAGQSYLTPTYMMDRGTGIFQIGMNEEDDYTGWRNQPLVPELSNRMILEQIQKIQRTYQITPSRKLEGEGYNLTIEMETGVGKTYTYIKTMFELNKHYGWSKFIVVVPSIAIREGVYKSFEVTQEHFAEEYGKKIRFFIYNSAQLTEIDRFASDSSINVMIINSQAFNAKGSLIRKNNVNKTVYYDKLYHFLAIGEKYYEALRSGKKIDKIKQDKCFHFVQVNELINGSIRLEITGVSTKQWEQYFWSCKKYTALRKAGADKKYIDRARKRKDRFQTHILRKIDNMEMNEEACSLYRNLSVHLFENEFSNMCRAKGEEWAEFIQEISKSELEGLWKTDKNKFNEIGRLLYDLLRQMKEIKEQ